jgi:HEAT repeat protein
MKLAALVMLLAVFAMPVVADDVDRWIQDLKDPIPAVREAAVVAFIGHSDTRAVDPLIQALKDKDPRVRMYAAFALGKLNDTIQALEDYDWQVRGPLDR